MADVNLSADDDAAGAKGPAGGRAAALHDVLLALAVARQGAAVVADNLRRGGHGRLLLDRVHGAHLVARVKGSVGVRGLAGQAVGRHAAGRRLAAGAAQAEDAAEEGAQGREVADKHSDAVLGVSPNNNVGQAVYRSHVSM
jgi:hypothetical protein